MRSESHSSLGSSSESREQAKALPDVFEKVFTTPSQEFYQTLTLFVVRRFDVAGDPLHSYFQDEVGQLPDAITPLFDELPVPEELKVVILRVLLGLVEQVEQAPLDGLQAWNAG